MLFGETDEDKQHNKLKDLRLRSCLLLDNKCMWGVKKSDF
jgi:hypothetical protein